MNINDLKYRIHFQKRPGYSVDIFEIIMGQPREISGRDFSALTKHFMTEIELKAYVEELAISHDWNKIIKIQEIIESVRDIP